MSKTIDRLLLFIKELGLSARQFDISIGTANGYTLRMYKNKASIGSDVIEKIVSTYPQINLVWLITGKGDMFLDSKEKLITNKADLAIIEKLIEENVDKKLADINDELANRLLKDINREISETKKKNKG